jgi:hypothetical protein
MTDEQPQWAERLLDKIEAKNTRKSRARPAVGLKFPVQWVSIIQQAARERDVTMAVYARRALMAFVCHDLKLDWDTVMQDEPKMQTYNQPAAPEAKYGTGYGKWKIGGLL